MVDLRFTQVRYAPSGIISVLFSEIVDTGQLIPRRLNLLI